MPLIRIAMFPRPDAVKKALAKDITDVIVRHCQVPPEATWIVFEDIPKDHWAIGGTLASDKPS